MPTRKVPLVTNEIYHIFNRGIDRRPTFTDKRELDRALDVIQYYRFESPFPKLSRFLKLPTENQLRITEEMQKKNKKLIEIYSFCLMSNHYHFLVKQLTDNGISNFISLFQNSSTRYFNTKHERVGPLFLDEFKSVRIETDEQFIHVSRYIHLNPFTSYVVKDFESLIEYPWSSFPEFINGQPMLCKTEMILSFFKNSKKYLEFVKDQADYQRKLHRIEHLILEDL